MLYIDLKVFRYLKRSPLKDGLLYRVSTLIRDNINKDGYTFLLSEDLSPDDFNEIKKYCLKYYRK